MGLPLGRAKADARALYTNNYPRRIKMKGKKLLAALMAVLLIISCLSACSGGDSGSGSSSESSEPSKDSSVASEDSSSETSGVDSEPESSNTGVPASDVYEGEVNGQTYPISDEKITLKM